MWVWFISAKFCGSVECQLCDLVMVLILWQKLVPILWQNRFFPGPRIWVPNYVIWSQWRILWQRRFCPGPRNWVSIIYDLVIVPILWQKLVSILWQNQVFFIFPGPKNLGADYVIWLWCWILWQRSVLSRSQKLSVEESTPAGWLCTGMGSTHTIWCWQVQRSLWCERKESESAHNKGRWEANGC